VVNLSNMSLLPNMGGTYRLTASELTDAIWNELVVHLERRI